MGFTRRWTREEDLAITESYKQPGRRLDLATRLGRSISAVYQRATKLGVSTPESDFSGAPDLPDVLRAYLAGMLDGEGSIQIDIRSHRYFGLTIQISSTTPGILEQLRKDCLSLGDVTSYKPKDPTRRLAFNWRFYSREAEFLLEQAMPYLRIKKERAQLALRFQKQVLRKGTFSRWHGLSQRQVARRSILAAQMKRLNAEHGKGKLRMGATGR